MMKSTALQEHDGRQLHNIVLDPFGLLGSEVVLLLTDPELEVLPVVLVNAGVHHDHQFVVTGRQLLREEFELGLSRRSVEIVPPAVSPIWKSESSWLMMTSFQSGRF